MELIRKTKVTITKNGNKLSWGLFLCPYCLQEVEKQLSNGKVTKSCGCVTSKLLSEILLGEKRNYKHGGSNTRLYKIWNAMKQRCLNSKSGNYKYYGGRGITICPEWTNDYIVFRDWSLNHGYKENLQINRIENNGNYEPNNCNFVTAKENTRNRRPLKLNLKIANEIRTLYNSGYYTQKELAEKYNVRQSTISLIINNKNWIKHYQQLL